MAYSMKYKARWARAHPEGGATWRKENIEKVRAYKRKWKKVNHEKHLASKRRWRARRSGANR